MVGLLARWHAEPARLLVLDEPFQGIDVGARADIFRAIRAHAHERATLVFVNDVEEAFKAGYIYVEGFPALDRRDKAWTEFKKAHPGVEQVAQWGAVDDTTAATVANQTAAVLRAHPDINVIIAPYDEFARGAKLAVVEAGLQDRIRIYSVDVSTSDIQEIREPGSPWVATSATSSEGNGEVQVRALALALTGELKDKRILQQPTLITREFLETNDIKNIEQLTKALPDFLSRQVASAPWIPSN